MMVKIRSACLLIIGFSMTGIGCALYVYCNLGSDAFNVLTQGVSCALGIQVGNAYYLTQSVLLLFILAVRKRYIGAGTVLGIFLIGSIMNLWGLILGAALRTAPLVVRLCCLATAPGFIGLGIAFVRQSGQGMVPNDIVPVILHEWIPQFQFKTVRIFNDGVLVLIGMALGGTVGIGTVLCVLLKGPCIQRATSLLDDLAKGRVS